MLSNPANSGSFLLLPKLFLRGGERNLQIRTNKAETVGEGVESVQQYVDQRRATTGCCLPMTYSTFGQCRGPGTGRN